MAPVGARYSHRMAEPFRFTPETNIYEALERDARVREAFLGMKLHCWDPRRKEACAAAEQETLADAARLHERPLDSILEELNRLDLPAPEGKTEPAP